MPTSTIPSKTQLGIDELRHRTRRLSQRHRTMLLLIDGQRPLSQVLSLAQQAGAATSHFEELVMLGMVELPMPPQPEPQEVLPDEVDAVPVISVDLVVLEADEGAVEVEPAAPVGPSVEPAVIEPAITEPAIIESPPAEEAWERTIKLQGPAERVDAVDAVDAPLPPPEPLQRRPRPPANLPVLDEVDEAAMLQMVRELLIDTLRLDAPLFGARTFVRVRAAQTAHELTELVWEIEHHLSHARHSRKELLSLQRARELLGLGNTLVADDDRPGFPEY